MDDRLRSVKVLWLLLGMAIFLVVLLSYIIPHQGGTIPSSTIRADLLANASFQEVLPIQTVDLANSGRSLFIALTMNTHVLFANLHLGGAWIAVLTLVFFLYTRQKRFERLARSLTLFNVILFSAGATFAATAMFFFIGLFPQFASNAFHSYWWPLFAEAILFGLIIFFLYTFWFTWGKISTKWHLFLGFGYAISVFFQVLTINTLAAGMLTPNNTSLVFGNQGIFTIPINELLTWWFNPTLFPLQFHRLAAAVAAIGFVIALFSMLHYNDQKTPGSKRYWDWVGTYGMTWGLLGFIFQPVLGLAYMMMINNVQPTAFDFMMHGPRAWAMLLMVGILSGMMISAIVYFIDRKEQIISIKETRHFSWLLILFLVAAVISAIILVQPGWIGPLNQVAIIEDSPLAVPWVLGSMDWKYIGLGSFMIIGALLTLMGALIVSDVRQTNWGNLSRSSRYAGILIGMLGTWIIPVMGYVREGGRAPWTIYQIIPVPGMTQFPTPIPVAQIFLAWAALITLTVLIFWLVSRATAYHPEAKEKIDEEEPYPPPPKPEDYTPQGKQKY
ncbi:MAG: cytochrome ubiquinol oxidase subunit I [Methanobacterium sp.]